MAEYTREQIDEMKASRDCINYDVARHREREVFHDVMAHVYAYGQQCPKAKPIIHLGATSCYVTDNTDILIMMDGLRIIRNKLLTCMYHLSVFAEKYKDPPTLVLPFSTCPTDYGKISCLASDLMLIQKNGACLEQHTDKRGERYNGTQPASPVDGDQIMNWKKTKIFNRYPVTGQTYPRKLDSRILNLLGSIAQSAYKFSNDLRLLQSLKELEEPFGEKQIGSSAMAYKRNPMKAERISSLARFVIINALNPAITASTQWLERTLDDSANRRLVIPQCFLAVDGILNIYINIASGLVVYPKIIEQRIKQELPFMATEYILMEAVKRGGDRQELHEKIRLYSMAAAKRVKECGEENNLLELIAQDPAFRLSEDELDNIMEPGNFTGRAPNQVEEFLSEYIKPILNNNMDSLVYNVELNIASIFANRVLSLFVRRAQ